MKAERLLHKRFTVIRPPEQMRVLDDTVDFIGFLTRLRNQALRGRKPVFLDMKRCKQVSSIACLLLAAEIERCIRLRPKCINGRDPIDDNAKFVLGAYGFYDLLGIRSREPIGPQASVLRIVTGGDAQRSPDENAGERTFEVASMAAHVLGEELADRVHSALNEATDNVIGHAYKHPSLLPIPDCLVGRWWVSGIGDPATSEAYFFVYDQGATIPKTVPMTDSELTRRVFLNTLLDLPAGDIEATLLIETIRQKRTNTLQGERGKGLAHMIGLIDEVSEGAIFIFSGLAYYMYTRQPDNSEPDEQSGPLKSEFPGTLIVWKIRRTKSGIEEHGSNSAS